MDMESGRNLLVKKQFKAYLVIIFVTLICLSASAQDDIESPPGQLGEDFYYFYGIKDYIDVEVDVASMFQEEDLVVGSTVSRITPEMWRRMGARRYTDALETQTSMVNYPTIFGFNTPVIRGYSRSALTTKGVVTLVDGIPVIEMVNGTNDGMPNFGLGALNEIELIKGPGSAIYGSDAFHGVIALNTFEAEEDNYEVEAAGAWPLYGDASFRVSQGLGEYFRINASAGYNQQIASEELEYDYYSEPDSGSPVAGTDEYENRYRTATGVFKVDIMPFDKLGIDLGGYIVNNKCDDFPGVKENDFNQLEVYDKSWQDSTIYIYRGAVNYEIFNNISVEAKGYYWFWDMMFGTYFEGKGSVAEFNVDEERSGADIILKQQDNAINLQWLIAYSNTYSKVRKKVMTTFDNDETGTAEGAVETLPDQGMKRHINSVYAQTKWGIIENTLFLLLGGRLDNYSDWGNQLSPRGGIIVLPTNESSIKALYGRAFRAPSGNAQYGVSDYILGNEDIKPEIIDIFELDYIYKGKDWKLNVNFFYSIWKDGIIVEPFTENALNSGFAAEFTNSGRNRAYGCEASIFYPVDPVSFDIGGSYIKSTALDLKTPGKPADDYDYETFPEYIIIACLHYNIKPVDLNFYLKNRLYLNMKETSDTDEQDDLPQYYRVDLNINKQIMEKLDLYLDVRNLTNRKNYLPSLYTSVLREEDGIPEAGISVLLRVKYIF